MIYILVDWHYVDDNVLNNSYVDDGNDNEDDGNDDDDDDDQLFFSYSLLFNSPLQSFQVSIH